MAITSYDTTTRALNWDMTVEEFKEWIKKFDINGDGRISKAELRRVIRSLGGRFSSWKSRRWIQQADSDGDGYIEEDEIDNLVEYAQKTLGLKIVAY
ncbi:polcalcin Cyn d 7-like [Asparagus officinalis]|uniref:polcalcin Cyn d 7-like n=1 Tax=Asparagus officinalis TaxID=4686 RepID=UPI00098DFA80|nr:polcalcin Cyn d 7-like [Asparagus officinalis]